MGLFIGMSVGVIVMVTIMRIVVTFILLAFDVYIGIRPVDLDRIERHHDLVLPTLDRHLQMHLLAGLKSPMSKCSTVAVANGLF